MPLAPETRLLCFWDRYRFDVCLSEVFICVVDAERLRQLNEFPEDVRMGRVSVSFCLGFREVSVVAVETRVMDVFLIEGSAQCH